MKDDNITFNKDPLRMSRVQQELDTSLSSEDYTDSDSLHTVPIRAK